jgi:hypothetical protein
MAAEAEAGKAAPEAKPLDPALLAGAPFAEVRRSPLDHVGETVKWYAEFQSASGTRVTYIGAKSSSTGSPYRFIVDYGPGATLPAGNGLVTGKVAGTETVSVPATGAGGGSFSFALLPLLVEGKFEPLAQPVACPTIEDVKPAPPIIAPPPPPPSVEPPPAVAPRPVAPSPRPPLPVRPSVRTTGRTAPDPNPPLDREQAVLRLLGDKPKFTVIGRRPSAPSSAEGDKARSETVPLIFTTMRTMSFVDSLRESARIAAERLPPDYGLVIKATLVAGVPLADIQRILGPENYIETDPTAVNLNATSPRHDGRTPETAKRPEKWYRYGWLAFGESEGMVVGVNAEPSKLYPNGLTPKTAAPGIPAAPTAQPAATPRPASPGAAAEQPARVAVTVSGETAGWTVIFRSSDPSIWNKEVNRGRDAFAIPLAKAPPGVQFLKMSIPDGACVIIPMANALLPGTAPVGKGTFWWDGTGIMRYRAYHLGIYDKSVRKRFPEVKGTVGIFAGMAWENYSGWGFGSNVGYDDKQSYAWNNAEIPPTVLEISVKTTPLTEAEKKALLD